MQKKKKKKSSLCSFQFAPQTIRDEKAARYKLCPEGVNLRLCLTEGLKSERFQELWVPVKFVIYEFFTVP